ncbi:MAG: hypothetical protein R3B95_06760 [Nitrospirales bacterium]|nr:hypothetical protein [Nitrospirales bacterium]
MGFTQFRGYVSFVDLLPGQRRSDDHVDVAYYRLDRRFADGMLKFFKPGPRQDASLLRIPCLLRVVLCLWASGKPV